MSIVRASFEELAQQVELPVPQDTGLQKPLSFYGKLSTGSENGEYGHIKREVTLSGETWRLRILPLVDGGILPRVFTELLLQPAKPDLLSRRSFNLDSPTDTGAKELYLEDEFSIRAVAEIIRGITPIEQYSHDYYKISHAHTELTQARISPLASGESATIIDLNDWRDTHQQ